MTEHLRLIAKQLENLEKISSVPTFERDPRVTY